MLRRQTHANMNIYHTDRSIQQKYAANTLSHFCVNLYLEYSSCTHQMCHNLKKNDFYREYVKRGAFCRTFLPFMR